MSQRASARVTIQNRLGFHARPATAFAQLAMEFESSIVIKGPDEDVDGKSIMQILMLGATQGTSLEIIAEGADSKQAIEKLSELVESGFGEE